MASGGGVSGRGARAGDAGSAAIGLTNELAKKASATDRALRAVFLESPERIELNALNARAYVHLARERYSQLLAESENARDAIARSDKANSTSRELRKLTYDNERPDVNSVIDAFTMEITVPVLKNDARVADAIQNFVSILARLPDSEPNAREDMVTRASDDLSIYLSALAVVVNKEVAKINSGDETYLDDLGLYDAARETMIDTLRSINEIASIPLAENEYVDVARALISRAFAKTRVIQDDIEERLMNANANLPLRLINGFSRVLLKGNVPRPLTLLRKLVTPFEDDDAAIERDNKDARAALGAIDKSELRIIQVAEAIDAILLPGLSARPLDSMDLHKMCDDFISQCGAETDKIGDVVSLYGVNGGLSHSGRAVARYGRVYDLAEQTRITVNDVNVRKLEAQTLDQNVRSRLFSNMEALNKCANAGLDPIVLSNTFKTPISRVASRLYELWVNSPASIDSRELSNSLSYDDLESRLLDSDEGPLDPVLYSNDRVDTYSMSLAAARGAIRHLPIISYDDARDLVDLLAGRVMMRVVRLDNAAKDTAEEDQKSVNTVISG